MTAYDSNNVFAKILRGEVPCKKVYEDAHVLAFEDIKPEATVHVLVIPRSQYASFNDFARNAPPETIAAFWASVQNVAESLGLTKSGYRLITNHGPDASQTVHHFHVHILGGKPLGALLA